MNILSTKLTTGHQRGRQGEITQSKLHPNVSPKRHPNKLNKKRHTKNAQKKGHPKMLNKNCLPKMLNKNVTQKACPVWPMANDPLCIACRFWARLQPIFSSTGSWRKIEKNKTNWENWTICEQIGSSCVLMSKSICEMWSLVQVKVKVVKVAKSEVADSGAAGNPDSESIKCWLSTFHTFHLSLITFSESSTTAD